MNDSLEQPQRVDKDPYPIVFMIGLGRAVVTREMVEKAMAAEDRFNNRTKPPKPPRGKLIGRISILPQLS